METAAESKPAASFDRRLIYRPFLERLNPIGSPRALDDGLIVVPGHDPRDTGQPPIHEAFANTAELTRGSQMALVGGIGSGKTTELLLTQKALRRHMDAVNVFVDLAEYTDLTENSSGAILAAAGMRLYPHVRSRLRKLGRKIPDDTESAYAKLKELAFGRTSWMSVDSLDQGDDDPNVVQVRIPGIMKPRFPPLHQKVAEVQVLLQVIAGPLIEADDQVTLLIDGLDRLIQPDTFRRFTEQDLQAIRETGISVVIVAPLLLWYDKSRFLQNYFDLVKHIPAAAADPKHSGFLKEILQRRGALDLMNRSEIASMAKYSGGVLRDLLTLARSSAEYAYRDSADRISRRHVNQAIKQLGNGYQVGLGRSHRYYLQRLAKDGSYPIQMPIPRELLVNRQVLEYFSDGLESFAVHPALAKTLSKAS